MRKVRNAPSAIFFCYKLKENQRKKVEKIAERYEYLTFEDRQNIEKWYAAEDRVIDIATRLKKYPATIYRELHRGFIGEKDGKQIYSAEVAEAAVKESFKNRGRKRARRGATVGS